MCDSDRFLSLQSKLRALLKIWTVAFRARWEPQFVRLPEDPWSPGGDPARERKPGPKLGDFDESANGRLDFSDDRRLGVSRPVQFPEHRIAVGGIHGEQHRTGGLGILEEV